MKSYSWSVSFGKRLIATTAGIPWALTFSICFSRLQMPASSAAMSSRSSPGSSGLPATMRKRPECILSARIVVTTTAAFGARPDARHLMLKNFSQPMSAPKPASVTT